jgi:subtilisin family serine protease
MNFRWKILVLACLAAVGCKKESDSSTDGSGRSVVPTPTPPPSIGATTAKQDFSFTYTPSFSVPAGSTFSLSRQPTWMSINSSTGAISGVVADSGTLSGIYVTAKNGTESTTVQFDLTISGDTLGQYQWALENTGQTSYARNAGLAGMDMKVKDAHRFGAYGTGVNVLVSDEGLQITHEDLADNILTGKSKNYYLPDPYFGDPAKPDPSKGNHGTSVAGIIAAEGWNGMGIRGVAPEAKIAGTNYLSADADKTGKISRSAIEIDQASVGDAGSAEYDVFNYSYGYGYPGLVPISDALVSQLIYGITNHRAGKGSVYVKSAGNSYNEDVIALDEDGDVVTDVDGYPLYESRAISANHEETNATPWTFVIGATNARGTHASYSSSGANLLVSAPGGEDGVDDPAILTTDESTCNKGYSPYYSYNAFEAGTSPNTSCNYTSLFNGTSSAAPHVTGVVALMLSVKPTLTWRDVRHLLVTTATQVDPTHAASTASISGTSYVVEDGWVTNGAGFKFNPLYGFGQVNAEAAVRAASAYTSFLPTMKQTVTPSGHCPETTFCADDTWTFTNATGQTITNNNATGDSDQGEHHHRRDGRHRPPAHLAGGHRFQRPQSENRHVRLELSESGVSIQCLLRGAIPGRLDFEGLGRAVLHLLRRSKQQRDAQ